MWKIKKTIRSLSKGSWNNDDECSMKKRKKYIECDQQEKVAEETIKKSKEKSNISSKSVMII